MPILYLVLFCKLSYSYVKILSFSLSFPTLLPLPTPPFFSLLHLGSDLQFIMGRQTGESACCKLRVWVLSLQRMLCSRTSLILFLLTQKSSHPPKKLNKYLSFPQQCCTFWKVNPKVFCYWKLYTDSLHLSTSAKRACSMVRGLWCLSCLLVASLIQKMQFFKEGFLTLLQISEVLLQWMNKANAKSGE